MGSLPPLAVDVDGTLTRPDKSLDPRVIDPLREWAEAAPVVVATGKAFPYPVALCEFLGVPSNVVAENGGAVYAAGDEDVVFTGDREAVEAVRTAYLAAGHDLGWGDVDLVNRWRETEIAVSRESPLAPLESLAAEHGLEIVDSGYAYHVKSPAVDKGTGLRTAAERLGRDPSDFVAVGDSENDAEVFATVGRAYAVANADATAREAADVVTEDGFADGFLEVYHRIRSAD